MRCPSCHARIDTMVMESGHWRCQSCQQPYALAAVRTTPSVGLHAGPIHTTMGTLAVDQPPLSDVAPRPHSVGAIATTHGITPQQAPRPVDRATLTISTAPGYSRHGTSCGRARIHWVPTHPISYMWADDRGGWQVTCSCGRVVGMPYRIWSIAMDRARQWTDQCVQQHTLMQDTTLPHRRVGEGEHSQPKARVLREGE